MPNRLGNSKTEGEYMHLGILRDCLGTAKLHRCAISLNFLGFVGLSFAELCSLNCQTDLIVHL